MIKIEYSAKPFYSECNVINDSAKTNLVMEFEEDSSSTEILAGVVKILRFATYHIDKDLLLRAIEDMDYEGLLEKSND